MELYSIFKTIRLISYEKSFWYGTITIIYFMYKEHYFWCYDDESTRFIATLRNRISNITFYKEAVIDVTFIIQDNTHLSTMNDFLQYVLYN